MHSAGTTIGAYPRSFRVKHVLIGTEILSESCATLIPFIEGPWDRVHQVIGQAHTILHRQGIVRIQTDIRVGSR